MTPPPPELLREPDGTIRISPAYRPHFAPFMAVTLVALTVTMAALTTPVVALIAAGALVIVSPALGYAYARRLELTFSRGVVTHRGVIRVTTLGTPDEVSVIRTRTAASYGRLIETQVWQGRGRLIRLPAPLWGVDSLDAFAGAIGAEPFDDPDLFTR